VREAEIDQGIAAFEIGVGEGAAVLVKKFERTADLGASDAFGGFGDAGALHARFFIAEVEDEEGAGGEEEEACFPGEGL
jgi:hypothetical protein